MSRRPARAKPVIGWREWVVLPELSPVPVKAKIDTGARTSALHAFDLSIREKGGAQWAHFEVHPTQRSARGSVPVSLPIVGFRRVRSSTGHTEERAVVRTPLVVGEHHYDVDLTLTSRDQMGFRMLLGRAAVSRRFLVNPGRSFLTTLPDPYERPRKDPRP